MKKYFKLPLIFLIIIFLTSFFLMFFSARFNSQTTDEGVHLFAGYTYITQRDFRLDPEHPPLLKELSALPLLFWENLQVNLDNRWEQAGNFYYDSWQEARSLGEDFLYNWGNSPEKMLLWGRIIPIILTLILGYFAYFWAKKLYGQIAGVFAAFLTLLFPNILAHGHLINTDLILTLFIFIAVYFWGEFLKSPKWIKVVLAGIFIGLALASKFTAVILVPILIILVIAKLVLDKEKKDWWKYLLGLVGVKIVTFIIVWASYGFSLQAPPVNFSNELLTWVNQSNYSTIFDKVVIKIRPILFPADFYKGLVLVVRHSISGHGAFLLGQNSNTGWWYYFPVAILAKTPIPIFVFLGLAIGFWKKIKAKLVFDELLLIIPPIVFLGFSMISKADLGIRHILPVFPFIFVFCAKSINLIDFRKFKLATVGFLILILWYFLSAIISFPNYIAYFNEFAGGSKGGYRVLTDSNLDWGQDIFLIKDYLDKNDINHVYLVYPWDGDSALRFYGINYTLLKPEDINVKGKVIISATYYQTEAYKWLKKYPATQITPGVFLVDVN